MSGLGDGLNRTSRHALSAGPLRKKEAVCVVVGIGPGGGGDPDARHHGAGAHGLPAPGDQPIAEAECPQP